MNGFRQRNLASSQTLGERLKAHREQAGIDIPEVARATGVSAKYLIAIEESAVRRLPGEVYVRNFLRQYANYLRLDVNDVLAHYDRERGVVRQLVRQDRRFVQRHVDAKPLFTPKRVRTLVLILGIAVVLGYLAWQVWSIVRPPELTIESPPAQLTTKERTVEVVGVADPESDVTINGQKVLIDTQGRFTEQIDLQAGLNTIRISAVRKRSKPQTVYRQILVQNESDQPGH